MHFILIIFSIDKESLNVMSDICSWGTNCMFLNSLFFFFLADQAANDCGLEPVAYEFFTQAFVLYEEEIAVIVHEIISCD